MSEQKTSTNPVRRFFSFIWGAITWLRRTLANLIFLLILVIITIAVSQQKPDVLPGSFALYLAPSGFLVDERQPLDPLSTILGGPQQEGETLVSEVVEAINRATTDNRVTHLIIDLNHLNGGGISKLSEISQALQTFKASGKKVTAYADQYMQSQYYLASHADKIYLHDMGYVLLTGYGSYRTYFKEAIDKLGLNFHIFRAGKFKDAVEPYLRNDMSDASREHNSQWINSLWQVYTSRTETLRSLPAGAIEDLIKQSRQRMAEADGDPAQLAAQAGLVDRVVSRQQLRAELIDEFGYDHDADSFKAIHWQRYLHNEPKLAMPGKSYVAVINATGTIYDGEQPPGSVGSTTFVNLLRQAREDQDVKAIVVRIDSPGGSAFASEVIRAEIKMTRDGGKPVLVSMGSVAASGGYWMATGADEIWALPTTITGSIGVYSVIPTLDDSLRKLGIHNDGIGTTELSDALNPMRPMNSDTAFVLQSTVEGIYQRFLKTVAEARDLSEAQVDAIGQGRVWSGAKAREIGLVDKLGTLNDTIVAAAEFAELKEWEIKHIQTPLSPFEQFMQQLISTELPLPTVQLQTLEKLKEYENVLGLTQLLNFTPMTIYAQCLECTLWQ